MRFFRRDIPVADIEVAVDFLVAVLVLGFAGIWAVKEFMSTPPYVDPERFPIRGDFFPLLIAREKHISCQNTWCSDELSVILPRIYQLLWLSSFLQNVGEAKA